MATHCNEENVIREYQRPEGAIDYHKICKYRFLYDARYGVGGFYGCLEQGTYIIPSRSEPRPKFEERVERGFFPNMFSPFVTSQYLPVSTEQAPTTTIFGASGKPLETTIPYDRFLSNVNGAGLTKDQFYRICADASYTSAVSYLVMDKLEGDEDPYCYMQSASTVQEDMIITDRKGNLEQIAFVVEDGKDKDNKTIYRRTTWTNDNVRVETSKDKKKWDQESFQELQVDSMPVHAMFSEQRLDTRDYLPFPATSWKIASLNTVLYNSSTEYNFHINQQAIARMWTSADLESIGDGNSFAIKLDNEIAGTTPNIGFINADTGIAKNHLEYSMHLTDHLINFMAEAGVIVSRMDKNDDASGRSKAFTYRAQNTKLNNTVQMYVGGDQWMQKFYKQYNDVGGEWDAVTTYKTDYSIQDPVTVTDIVDIVDVVTQFQLLEPVQGSLKSLARKIAKNDTEYKKMESAIDDMVALPNQQID